MKCPKCQTNYDLEFHRPIYNYSGKKTCRKCAEMEENFHIDRIEIAEAGPILVQPFCSGDENVGRNRLVEFIFLLFDNNPSKAVYPLIGKYIKKGYTYLGMIRALEYFYKIKRNSTAKSNLSIGIIPHIYDEAQKYYSIRADAALRQAQQWYNFNPEEVVKIVPKREVRQNPQIDMTDL